MLASAAVRKVRCAAEIPPRLLQIDDAASYLSMSDKGIRRLIMEGQIPYVQRILGRSPYLIDVHDLDAWVERNKVRPSTGPQIPAISCQPSATERSAVANTRRHTRNKPHE